MAPNVLRTAVYSRIANRSASFLDSTVATPPPKYPATQYPLGRLASATNGLVTSSCQAHGTSARRLVARAMFGRVNKCRAPQLISYQLRAIAHARPPTVTGAVDTNGPEAAADATSGLDGAGAAKKVVRRRQRSYRTDVFWGPIRELDRKEARQQQVLRLLVRSRLGHRLWNPTPRVQRVPVHDWRGLRLSLIFASPRTVDRAGRKLILARRAGYDQPRTEPPPRDRRSCSDVSDENVIFRGEAEHFFMSASRIEPQRSAFIDPTDPPIDTATSLRFLLPIHLKQLPRWARCLETKSVSGAPAAEARLTRPSRDSHYRRNAASLDRWPYWDRVFLQSQQRGKDARIGTNSGADTGWPSNMTQIGTGARQPWRPEFQSTAQPPRRRHHVPQRGKVCRIVATRSTAVRPNRSTLMYDLKP